MSRWEAYWDAVRVPFRRRPSRIDPLVRGPVAAAGGVAAPAARLLPGPQAIPGRYDDGSIDLTASGLISA